MAFPCNLAKVGRIEAKVGHVVMRWMKGWWLAGLSLCGGLLACAPAAQTVAAPAATAAPDLRTLCRLTTPRPVDADLTRELSQAAGLHVRQVRALDAQWLQVTFTCESTELCQAGLVRLAAARSLVSEVTPDGRVQLPRTPNRAQERQ